MKRELKRLTPRRVATCKMPGYHPDGGGLYLQVSASGAKSWIFRYVLRGRERHMGLGSALDIGLAKAREKAADARRLLIEGNDPLEERKANEAARALASARSISFAKCAESYIAAHRPKWKNAKHAEQWTSTIETYANPIVGKLPVADIDLPLVLKVLEPIWTAKPETASRLRGRMERILSWATTRGYRSGDNPARWKGHLDEQLPAMGKKARRALGKFRHHAALPYAEVGAFVKELRERDGVAARALEFAILTAARTGEVIGAKRSEFALEAATWTIPAERMKAGREHRVPLSPRAVELVRGQDGEHVFPLSNMAMLQLLERMGRDSVTIHGFRSTFRDWCGEQTAYPREIAEAALSHVVGDAAEQAYSRSDLLEKRRQLMLEWSRYCDRPTAPGHVIPLAKRA